MQRRNRQLIIHGAPQQILRRYTRAYKEFKWTSESPADFDLGGELKRSWTPLGLSSMAYHLVPSFANRGWLKPLDELLPPKARARFAPKALELAAHAGQVYSMPDDITAFALLVRRDKLSEAGFQPPATWAELERQLQHFSKRSLTPVCGVEGEGVSGVMRFFGAALGSNGINVQLGPAALRERKHELVETYQWMKRLSGLPGGPLSMRNTFPSLQQLVRGELLYYFIDSGLITHTPAHVWESQLALIQFPLGPNGAKRFSWCAGGGWIVPHNSIAPDLALDVLADVSELKVAIERDFGGPGFAFPAQPAMWRSRRLLSRFPGYAHADAVLNAGDAIAPGYVDLPFLMQMAEAVSLGCSENLSAEEWWVRCWLAEAGAGVGPRAITNSVLHFALAHIHANIGRLRGVSEVADAASRNPDYLNRLFRKHLKLSCREYIGAHRMTVAKSLLPDATLSIKEIASRVGMRNFPAFSRAFHRHWRTSATELRRQLLSAARQ